MCSFYHNSKRIIPDDALDSAVIQLLRIHRHEGLGGRHKPGQI